MIARRRLLATTPPAADVPVRAAAQPPGSVLFGRPGGRVATRGRSLRTPPRPAGAEG